MAPVSINSILSIYSTWGNETYDEDITQLAHRESWRLGIWGCDSGLKFPCEEVPVPHNTDTNDPLTVLRSTGQPSQGLETILLVLQNFHRFLGAPEILQAVQQQVSTGKHTQTFVVILAEQSAPQCPLAVSSRLRQKSDRQSTGE